MNITPTEAVIYIVIGLLVAIQLLYTFVLYNAPHRRVVADRKGKLPLSEERPGISVVIAASDCEQSLAKHLPLILEQDYPNFEVIVVDDNSKDETKDLLQQLAERYHNLYTTFTSDSIRYISHKKLALTLGIKAAKNEWVVFTEPDCYPVSRQWLASLARHFTASTDVVLGYCNYEHRTGFGNRCQMFDTLQQQLRLLGLTLRRRGYMGMGRNMAYRKELFFANKGYSSHLDLDRGEDDLFVNEHIPSRRIAADVSANSVVRCSSANGYAWKGDRLSRIFISSKMRGVQRYLLGADTLSRTLLYTATAAVAVISILHHWWITLAITLGLWLLSLGCRLFVYHRTACDLDERRYLLSLPLFEILHPWWEAYFRLCLLFSSKQAYMRRKV